MKSFFLVLATAGAFAAVSATAATSTYPAQTHPRVGKPASSGHTHSQPATPQQRATSTAQQAGTRPTDSKPNKSGLDSDGNRRTNNGKDVPLLNKVRAASQANTSN